MEAQTSADQAPRYAQRPIERERDARHGMIAGSWARRNGHFSFPTSPAWRKETPMGKAQKHPLRAFTLPEAQELHRIAKATSERLDVVKRARALLSVRAGRSFDFCCPRDRIQKRRQYQSTGGAV